MKVRKLETGEVEQIVKLFIYCIDQVKDLETVTLSKFREISGNGGSIVDYLIKVLNNEHDNFLKDNIENYKKFMIGFDNLCIQANKEISLKYYLDAILTKDSYSCEKQFCVSNNGLAYFLALIMEVSSPSFPAPLEI